MADASPRAGARLSATLLFLLLCACAAPRPKVVELSVFRKAEARDSVVVEYHRARGPVAEDMRETFYVFGLAGVRDTALRHLSYLGTEKGHHLFRIFQDVIVDNDLEYNIALPEAECDVADARTLEEEAAARGGTYRRARGRDGRCMVEATPSTPSRN